jgi:hypothetical protein
VAKITITLEDQRQGVTSSLDLQQASPREAAGLVPSRALSMGQALLDMVAMQQAINAVPRCSRLPASTTLH